MQQLLHYSFGNNTFMYCSVYFFLIFYMGYPHPRVSTTQFTHQGCFLYVHKNSHFQFLLFDYIQLFFFLDLNKMSNLPPATSLLISHKPLPIHCILNSVLPMNSVLIAVPNQNSQSYYQVSFKTTYAEIEASLKNWAEMLQCSPPLL